MLWIDAHRPASPEIHDRTLLSNSLPSDWALVNYWVQIHNVAHEFAHVFGAAVGEYYSLQNVPDFTGEQPVQSLEYYGYSGGDAPFWLEHVDYWSDPMLMWMPQLAWGDLIRGVRFAEVTAAMIDNGYRRAYPISRYVPDLSLWPPSLPPLVEWVSFYDAQEARMVFGRTNFIIPLHPWTTNPPPLSLHGFCNSIRLSWPPDPAFILAKTVNP